MPALAGGKGILVGRFEEENRQIFSLVVKR